MRHSSALLALSLGLHVSENYVTEAIAETVNDPNKAHTFFVIKDDTRPRGRYEDDERMFRPILGKIRSVFSEETPETHFEKFLRGAVETIDIEEVNAGLQAMKPDQMKRAVKDFKESQHKFLADKLIDKWGIEALATALVKTRRSEDENIKTNGNTLLVDLLDSLKKTAWFHPQNAFNRLKLNEPGEEHVGFTDGRVEVLYFFLKYSYPMRGDEQHFFSILKEGFGSYANLAHFISLAVLKDEAAKVYESMFVNHLVKNVDLRYLKRFEYKMFQQPEYEMVKRFFRFKDGRNSSHKMLDELIYQTYSNNKGKLALMLSKGVEENDLASKEYELLLFEHLKSNNVKIKGIFTEEDLRSDSAQKFVKRYHEWLLNKERKTLDQLA